MTKVLMTGGCGFIGSNFIHKLLSREDIELINLDALTYAGNRSNLSAIESKPNYTFHQVDISNRKGLLEIFKQHQDIDYVINFAAESHVDRSIENPDVFVTTNVLGTANLIHFSKEFGVKKFVQVSTDEVYGSLGPDDEAFHEGLPLLPNSPYSASKASADLLVLSYYRTYGFPAVITRCSNNYGPYQHPEKLIPRLITNCIQNINLPIYGQGKNVRDWIHVHDHCDGIWAASERGKSGEIYNFGGLAERENIEIAKTIQSSIHDTQAKIEFVEDRLGHDFRYAMNIDKVETELGWKPKHDFDRGLTSTIAWYVENPSWWTPLKKA